MLVSRVLKHFFALPQEDIVISRRLHFQPCDCSTVHCSCHSSSTPKFVPALFQKASPRDLGLRTSRGILAHIAIVLRPLRIHRLTSSRFFVNINERMLQQYIYLFILHLVVQLWWRNCHWRLLEVRVGRRLRILYLYC